MIRMNHGLSSKETGLAKLVEEWVGSMEGQAQDQVVILSGEEGAGKTFTAEILMENIMAMRGTKSLKRVVNAGWTVLRSLGSAATSLNSRSSRMVIALLYHRRLPA